jgi:outer membrane immunogenic protein
MHFHPLLLALGRDIGAQMNKILFGIVALAAMLAGPAMAAPPPVVSWTGIYVGGNVGGAWGHTNPGFTDNCGPDQFATATALGNSAINNPAGGYVTCFLAGLGGPDPVPLTAAALATSMNGGASAGLSALQQAGTVPFNNRGWTGGGQIGFNYQYQWAVFGLEWDFQAFNPKGSQSVTGTYPLTPGAQPCNSTTINVTLGSTYGGCRFGFNESSRGNWLTTLRGKVGAAWGNWLVYGTAGIAWARMSFTSNFADNTCAAAVAGASTVNGCNLASGFSTTQTRAGFVGGAGLSYMLTQHIIASIEYLRVEINGYGGDTVATSSNGCGFAGFACFPLAGPPSGTFTTNFHYNTQVRENIVRAKLDYKF